MITQAQEFVPALVILCKASLCSAGVTHNILLPANKIPHNRNANVSFSKGLKVYCQGIQLVCHRYSTGEETPPFSPRIYQPK